MPEAKIPIRVGKMGKDKKDLYNTYFITQSGLLIPDTFYFFSDTFRAVSALQAFSNFAKSSHNKELSSPEFLDSIIYKGKCEIDEILAITDSSSSYGIIKTDYRGKFLKDTNYFFNTDTLRNLFEHLSKQQYNFSKNELTDGYEDLKSYWHQLQNQYHSYITKRKRETASEKDPLPKGIEYLNLQFEEH